MQRDLIKIWEKLKKTVVFVPHSVLEAVYISDVIVVRKLRSGRIKGIIEANLPRPRDYTGEDYLEVRKQVLDLLEEEVQKEIQMNRS